MNWTHHVRSAAHLQVSCRKSSAVETVLQRQQIFIFQLHAVALIVFINVFAVCTGNGPDILRSLHSSLNLKRSNPGIQQFTQIIDRADILG